MYDKIEYLGKSLIQHGKSNNRIYLMKLNKSDYPEIIKQLENITTEKNYTKVFAKIPEWAIDAFQAAGFTKEAGIPKFYNGKTEAYFFSKYYDTSRAHLDEASKNIIQKNIDIALSKQDSATLNKVNSEFKLKIIQPEQSEELAELYRLVFKSYPFPIHEAKYLRKTMEENIVYFGIFTNDTLVAASSAEMDVTSKNVEMTDFATNPEFAGNNLSLLLLKEMETEMRKRQIKTFYTIARSYSAGMNITFARMGYTFAGTLINNTNIFGKIESMNVWFKSA